jgi:hypothetical protein
MDNSKPPIYQGPAAPHITLLSDAALCDFEHMVTQLTLAPIAHGFDGQLSAWQDARRALKVAIDPTQALPLDEQGKRLKRFTELERYRVQQALREELARYFLDAAHWQSLIENDPQGFTRHTHWQRHGTLAHWPANALVELATTLLPYFAGYIEQGEHYLVSHPVSDDTTRAFAAYLEDLKLWLVQQQRALAYAMLARLQSASQRHGVHADCLYDLVSYAQTQGYEGAPLAHLKPETSFNASTLQCFYDYLKSFPSLSEELEALIWFQPHPDWTVTHTEQQRLIWRPTVVDQALAKLPTPWFNRPNLAKRWCDAHLELWLAQRVITSAQQPPPRTQASLHRYREHQVHLQRALNALHHALPSRWNIFAYHSRKALLVMQRTLRTFAKQHAANHYDWCQQWVEQLTAHPFSALLNVPWDALLSSLADLKSHLPPYQQVNALTLHAKACAVQLRAQAQHIQQQAQHIITRLKAQPGANLNDWALVWQHYSQLQQSAPEQAGALAEKVQPLCQPLYQAVLAHLNGESMPEELQPGYPLSWVLQLLITFDEATQQHALQHTLTQWLYRLCQDAVNTPGQQKGVTWQRHQLARLAQLPVAPVADTAKHLLTLSQTHHALFLQTAQTFLDEQDAKMLSAQRTQLLQRLDDALMTQLTNTYGWSNSTRRLFAQCREQVKQGQDVSQVIDNTRGKINWLSHQSLAKRSLQFAAFAHHELNHLDEKSESLHSQGKLKRRLETQARQLVPKLSLFHAQFTDTQAPVSSHTPSAQRSPA